MTGFDPVDLRLELATDDRDGVATIGLRREDIDLAEAAGHRRSLPWSVGHGTDRLDARH
jgi:hypothetical protein